jgi:hypothetical protein
MAVLAVVAWRMAREPKGTFSAASIAALVFLALVIGFIIWVVGLWRPEFDFPSADTKIAIITAIGFVACAPALLVSGASHAPPPS